MARTFEYIDLNSGSQENAKKMQEISRKEVIMPGGIELTRVAESYMALSSDSKLLSVACGTGELELYFAKKSGRS